MAAEAINELENPSAAAVYLKPILDRALPAAKVTAYMNQATASKEAFFKAIVDQRAFEFAGEMYPNIDMIGSLCMLMARGAIISMIVVILILPSMLMVFDRVICATSAGFRNKNK